MGILTRTFARLGKAQDGGESFSFLSFGSGYTEIVASGMNNKLNFSRAFQSLSRATIQFNSGVPLKPNFCQRGDVCAALCLPFWG
jgi:hypothetical protein